MQQGNQGVEEAFCQLIEEEGLSGRLESFSPLHTAVLNGRKDMVHLLLEHGAHWETPKGGLSVFKLAAALGRLDLFPDEVLQEHRELEEMLLPVSAALKEYIENRNKRYLFKDLFSSGDKMEREAFIKCISDECQYPHSGGEGVLAALDSGLNKFQGVHFQTTLHKVILEFVEQTPDEDYSDRAQEILEEQELAYPEYVAKVRALYVHIDSINELPWVLSEEASETMRTLAAALKKDLDFFIYQHSEEPPDDLKLKQFQTKFRSRLHSQDLILCQQENWNSFALNLFLGLISVGCALVAQLIYSKWTTGQCTFFARGTEKQRVRDDVECGLDALVC